jgi:hypothetical protein
MVAGSAAQAESAVAAAAARRRGFIRQVSTRRDADGARPIWNLLPQSSYKVEKYSIVRTKQELHSGEQNRGDAMPYRFRDMVVLCIAHLTGAQIRTVYDLVDRVVSRSTIFGWRSWGKSDRSPR